MTRDLEEFLRKAAERRASRQTNARTSGRPVETQESETAPRTRGRSVEPSAESAEVQEASIDQADDRMSRRLKSTFEHSIGAIAPPTTSATAEVSAELDVKSSEPQVRAIEQIMTLLSRPDLAAQAILLREILDRPEHRW